MEGEASMRTLISTEESCLRHQTEGRYMEALQSAEKAYMLRCSIFGDMSQQAQNSRHTLVTAYNSVSITEINKGNSALAKRLLKKAEKVCEDMMKNTKSEDVSKCMKQQALTSNNLACLFRREGDLRSALDYALDALELEDQHNLSDNIASSFLNVCAILSQLNKHKEALKYAERALGVLHKNLQTEIAEKGVEHREAIFSDKAAIMAIAYHNVGVEQEYLKMNSESIISYQMAYEIASQNIGEEHSITKSLLKSFSDAKRAMEKAMYRKAAATAMASRASSASLNSSTSAPSPYSDHQLSSRQPPRSGSSTPSGSSRTRSSSQLGKFAHEHLQFASEVYQAYPGPSASAQKSSPNRGRVAQRLPPDETDDKTKVSTYVSAHHGSSNVRNPQQLRSNSCDNLSPLPASDSDDSSLKRPQTSSSIMKSSGRPTTSSSSASKSARSSASPTPSNTSVDRSPSPSPTLPPAETKKASLSAKDLLGTKTEEPRPRASSPTKPAEKNTALPRASETPSQKGDDIDARLQKVHLSDSAFRPVDGASPPGHSELPFAGRRPKSPKLREVNKIPSARSHPDQTSETKKAAEIFEDIPDESATSAPPAKRIPDMKPITITISTPPKEDLRTLHDFLSPRIPQSDD